MLIALMTYFFLSGGVTSAVLEFVADSEAIVKSIVVDDVRRDEALTTLKAMKARAKEQDQDMQRVLKQVKPELRKHTVLA